MSQFREDTGGPSVPVREINLIAYLPLVQPTVNSSSDLDLNPGHRRSSAKKAQRVLWLRKRISPLSHKDRFTYIITPPRKGSGVLRSVCLSVCLSVREHVSGTAGPIFTKFCAQIPCGRDSVLLWRRSDMLCTSGFTNHVTFGRSGPYGDAWGGV